MAGWSSRFYTRNVIPNPGLIFPVFICKFTKGQCEHESNRDVLARVGQS